MQICSAIRPAIRSAISAAIDSAFCAPAVAGPVLGQLFPITAPGVTAPGYYFDFSDLTEEKLAWRKNWLTYTDAPVVGTAAAIAWSFSNHTATNNVVPPPPGVNNSALITATATPASLSYVTTAPVGDFTFSVYTRMGTLPVRNFLVRNNTAAMAVSSFAFTYATGTGDNPNWTVQDVGGGWYRLSVKILANVIPPGNLLGLYYGATGSTPEGANWYVAGIQINLGDLQPYQSLSNVSNEFLAAFPYHSLFRDSLGAVASYSLEDPIGLALDLKFGGARGLELATNRSIPGLPSGGGTRTYQTGATVVAGRWYEVSADVTGYSGTGNVGMAGGAGLVQQPLVGNGRVRSIQIPNASGQAVFMFTADTNTANFSNISVREVYGNHATQVTVGDRPSASAKYNQFANSAWQGGGAAPTGWIQAAATGTAAPNGTVDGNVIYRQTAVAQRPFSQPPSITLAVGQNVTSQVRVHSIYSAPGGVSLSNLLNFVAATGNGTQVYFVNGVPALGSDLATPNSIIYCTFTCTTAGTVQPRAGLGVGSNITADLDLSSPALISGLMADVGRYQRTNADGTYDYLGFPSFARFNGINQSLSGTVDFSASDKVMWAATARKETDSAVAAATLNELTATYNTTAGAFVLFAPAAQNTPEWRFGYNIVGTGGARTKQALGYAAPVSSVLSMGIDAAQPGDQMVARVNGAPIAVAATNSGAGNFASAPFHIGRRNGATNPLNGNVHRITARGGAWDTSALSVAERLVNERTKWAAA